ncbi:DinB superfamily protein [compost metagenome]
MKLFDLHPDLEMTPMIGLLHATVTYNFNRLKRVVMDLTQEEIDYKGPYGEYNSIAQLLRHLAVVDLHWVFRLQSAKVTTDLMDIYGPMYDENGKLPHVSHVSLETLLDQYGYIQAMLTKVCLNLTDNDMCMEVPFEKGNTATIRWGIWHIADHSRHHYANIVHLKRRMRG